MQTLIQWSLDRPADWAEFDAAAWASAPKRPVPLGPSEINAQPGLVCGLNIQGVSFDGDHYAVEALPGGLIRATVWNDDPEDYPPGWRSARVRTFNPLAPTHRQAIGWLYKVLRNRKTQTATQWSLLADDETTVDAKATVSDDATTAIKQEIVTGP